MVVIELISTLGVHRAKESLVFFCSSLSKGNCIFMVKLEDTRTCLVKGGDSVTCSKMDL